MLPFQFGDPVVKPLFYNREDILKELYSCLISIKQKQHQDCALISPRRMGKSSILKMVMKKLEKEKIAVVYIDLSRLLPGKKFEAFLEKYIENILNAYKKTVGWEVYYFNLKEIMAGIPDIVKRFILNLKFGVEIKEIFTLWVEYKAGVRKDISKVAEKCFELPELLAKETKVPCIVFFDEFQEIYGFDHDLLWFIRSIIQHHVNTAYVITGSSVHLMNEITSRKKGAFYGHFLIKKVPPFSPESARNFLKIRAKSAHITFTKEAIDMIISKTNCIPFYLQWLGLHCYLLMMSKAKVTRRVEERDVEEAYIAGIKQLPQLEEELSKVSGRTKEVLIHLAINPKSKVSQIASSLRTSPQVVSRELKTLERIDYITKVERGVYEFVDKIFEDWIREKYIM